MLEVHPTGFYAWRLNPESKRAREDKRTAATQIINFLLVAIGRRTRRGRTICQLQARHDLSRPADEALRIRQSCSSLAEHARRQSVDVLHTRHRAISVRNVMDMSERLSRDGEIAGCISILLFRDLFQK